MFKVSQIKSNSLVERDRWHLQSCTGAKDPATKISFQSIWDAAPFFLDFQTLCRTMKGDVCKGAPTILCGFQAIESTLQCVDKKLSNPKWFQCNSTLSDPFIRCLYFLEKIFKLQSSTDISNDTPRENCWAPPASIHMKPNLVTIHQSDISGD